MLSRNKVRNRASRNLFGYRMGFPFSMSSGGMPPVPGHDIFIDAAYVYSDASGTTLCTDGQTIASFLNRSTGVITLPDSTGTQRPTYKAGPCFLEDNTPAIRISKALSQFIRFPSFAYSKRALTVIVVGSNDPSETYVGGMGQPTTTWSLGNSDYYQGSSGTVGEWLFPSALTSKIYRMQFPYPNVHVLGATQRIQEQFHSAQTGGVSAITAPTIQYKCDESSGNLLDSIGSRNLTAVNAPGSVAGKVGNARSFNGTNYFSAAADTTAQCLGVDFSISAWFKTGSDLTGIHQIVGCRNAGSADGNLAYILRTEGSNLVLYIGQGDSGVYYTSAVVGTVTTNTAYHFVFNLNKTSKVARYSFNGGAFTNIGFTYVPINSSANPKLNVGGDVLELWQNGGWIDAVQIWSGYKLTDSEMTQIYNSGNGWEYTGASETGTGLLIGARGSTPGTFGDLWLRHLLVYSRELSHDELHSTQNWALAQLGFLPAGESTPLAVDGNVLVMSGNSISVGSGCTIPPRSGIGSLMARRLKAYSYQTIGTGMGGQSGTTIYSYYPDQAGRYFTGRTGVKIAVIWEIVNAVQYSEEASYAAYYNKLGLIADAARTAGADYVIGVTAPVQNWGQETALRAVNDLLMADASNKFDYLVDCRQDQMGYFNAGLFADNYHPTDLGSQYLEEIIWQDGIRKIVDPEPDPYTSRLFGNYACSETSGDLIDSSAAGNNVPAVGSPGTDGAGARVVGATNRFESTNYLWQPVNEDFSLFVRFWFGSAADSAIIGWLDGSNTHLLLQRKYGNWVWTIGGGDYGASTENYPGGGVAMSAGAWHTWAISGRRRTHEMRMRRDGGAVETTTEYYWPWISMISSPQFFIGGLGTMPANSKIDRVIYWKGHAITDQQMLDLHNGIYPS